MIERYYSPKEIAELFSVSLGTAYNMINKMDYVMPSEGVKRVPESVLKRHIENNRKPVPRVRPYRKHAQA